MHNVDANTDQDINYDDDEEEKNNENQQQEERNIEIYN